MKCFLLLYLLLLMNGSVAAQQKEFVYKNFTQEEGLPSNEIYYSFEDSKHCLWFATDNGVARYNGHRFEVFETPDKTVFQIREDHKGRIWFFTYRAQFAYFENGKMHPYQFNDILKKRITKLHIKDVYIDSNEHIYLSSAIDSNYIIDKKGNITSVNHYKDIYGTSDFQVEQVSANTTFTKYTGRPAYGLNDYINVAVLNKGEKKQYQIPLLPNGGVQYGSICPDNQNVYFFYDNIIAKLMPDGTIITKKMPVSVLHLKYHKGIIYAGLRHDGICLLDENLSSIENSVHYFKGRSISSILFDYEDGLWVTSLEKGIFYVKNRWFKHVVTDRNDQPNITYSKEFNDSTLLFASPAGLHTMTNTAIDLFIGQANSRVIDVTITKDKKLVCSGAFPGMFGKLFNKTHKGLNGYFLLSNPTYYPILNKAQFLSPTAQFVYRQTSAFLTYKNYSGTEDSALHGKTELIFSKPAKLFKDTRGIVWGGVADGLYKSVAPYDTLLLENNSEELNKGIDFIAFLENNILAIQTQPGKIVLFDNEVIGTIDEKDGLLSNKIKFMLSVKNQLWVATVSGISVIEFSSYRPLKFTIRNIGKRDGLFNLTINHLAVFKNDIVAATSNGLYFIDKNILLQQSTPGIHFSISNINYYKGDVNGISDITLPYSKNRATIKYKAVSFNSFESIQYRYRFTSGDTLWRSTTSNELLLENLEPGSYTLEVKAVIPAQNRTSAVQTLHIFVEKPWWQNNWFRLSAFLFVSLLVYLIVKRRIGKIQAEEKRKTALNAKLTELEQTALRAQMNPHFIFNCLTSIQQLIISGNKVDANEYLVKFSRLIRKTLEMSAHPFISVAEEKEYLGEYLLLEQLRLSGKFDYTITADPAIDINQTFIPNMMLQPIVENCVRHGIKSLEERQGIITVHFAPGKNSVTCTIRDNGTGRGNMSSFNEKAFTKHRSYGMDIVRKRLETFSEFRSDEKSLEINDLYDNNGHPSGTEVILHLPYKNIV